MYTIEKKTLTDIADAIREKTGKSELIKPEEMDREIMGINVTSGLGTVMLYSGDEYPDSYAGIDADLYFRTNAIFDMRLFDKTIQNSKSMSYSASAENSGTFTWSGQLQIGAKIYKHIDVTNANLISYKLVTRACYDKITYPILVGISTSAPEATGIPKWVGTYNEHTETNATINGALDVSTISGKYYLIFTCPGWNVDIRNVKSDSEITGSVFFKQNGTWVDVMTLEVGTIVGDPL